MKLTFKKHEGDDFYTVTLGSHTIGWICAEELPNIRGVAPRYTRWEFSFHHPSSDDYRVRFEGDTLAQLKKKVIRFIDGAIGVGIKAERKRIRA